MRERNKEEGRAGMFYLTMHLYLRLYGIGQRIQDHSDSERGNPPLHGLLFPNSSKGSFICTIPQTG